jgi:hypothetical protein
VISKEEHPLNADFERHLKDIATYLHSLPDAAQTTAAEMLYKTVRDEYASDNTPGPWNLFRLTDSPPQA